MKEKGHGLIEYIAIYSIISVGINGDLPPETFFAADDDEAREKAFRIKEVLDFIESMKCISLKDKKNIVLKSVRNQSDKSLAYWIGYSSDRE